MFDVRLLEYFVAVAELEHVGKAAERLHVSQSPLSRQIRQLEEELQLQLFQRERQRIRLTEAGRWLLEQARGLLAHFERVRAQAEQRSRGQMGTLSIAFTSAAMWNGVLPKVLQRFEREFPKATVELRNMRSAAQLDAIRSGMADVAFVSMFTQSDDLEVTCVAEEPTLLVLPEKHALARKRRLTPADFEDVPFLLLSDTQAPERYERFLAVCAEAGFVPRVARRVAEPITLLALVESGLGVGLIRSSARNYAPRSLTFAKLPWLPLQSRTYMIRPATGRQRLADVFANLIPAVGPTGQ